MKKLVLDLMFFLVAINAIAGEWSGYIEDANCAKNMSAATIASAAHAGCARGCIKRGAKVVLVTNDGKVYHIANQDKVIDQAGLKVTLEGDIDGDTIKVSRIKM